MTVFPSSLRGAEGGAAIRLEQKNWIAALRSQ
jgi:hypothetical protein